MKLNNHFDGIPKFGAQRSGILWTGAVKWIEIKFSDTKRKTTKTNKHYKIVTLSWKGGRGTEYCKTVEKQVNNMRREFWRQTKGRRRLNSPQFDFNPRHSRFLPMSRGKDQHHYDCLQKCKDHVVIECIEWARCSRSGRRTAWLTAIFACREVLERNISRFRTTS